MLAYATLLLVPIGMTLHAAVQTTAAKKTKKKAGAKKGTTARKPSPSQRSTGAAQAKTANKSHAATAAQSHPKPTGKATAQSHPKPAGKSAVRKGKKPVRKTTWRNRQTAPTPDRYKEIQGALATKGYLPPEAATGEWSQSSVEALKKFQADQHIDTTGKLNSLSLIALGRGPRRDGNAAMASAAAASSN